jgi:hypothetical protein
LVLVHPTGDAPSPTEGRFKDLKSKAISLWFKQSDVKQFGVEGKRSLYPT